MSFHFMPNLYLVNHTRRFMAVCISKNACSTLKWLTLQDDYPEAARRMVPRPGHGLHNFFGYRANKQNLVAVGPKGSAKYPGYLRFAVWRDPVERALSTYRKHVLDPANPRQYFRHKALINCGLARFVDFVEEELGKDDPLQMDEHIRPQACYCSWVTGRPGFPGADVDVVVPIDGLDAFLDERFGYTRVARINASKSGIDTVPMDLLGRLACAYEMDSELLCPV